MDPEQIEDKIITELQTEITYVKTCETYAGQLAEDLSKLAINFPALYVVYDGSTIDWLDNLNYNEQVGFSVLICAKDARGNASLRKGDNGCYEMVQDVLDALTGETFGLDIEKLKPVSVALIFITKTVAVYGIKFQTNFDKTF